jgi:hypothetical protein
MLLSPTIPPTQSDEPDEAGPRLKVVGLIAKDFPAKTKLTVGTALQGTVKKPAPTVLLASLPPMAA